MSRKIIGELAERLYNRPVMDNRERGDYAEQLVASAVDSSWWWVGIGWHPWDFESGMGPARVRMQVRQSAAKQVWRRPQNHQRLFSTRIRLKPNYVPRDLVIEDVGRFCELYVFAWHGVETDDCDHRHPAQWMFYVLPERVLGSRKRVLLSELQSEWLQANGGRAVPWCQLGAAVSAATARIRSSR